MLAITEDPHFNIDDEADMEREVDINCSSIVILYELFRGKKVLQIANVKFLCALNFLKSCSKEQYRNVISKRLRNRSLPALNTSSLTEENDFA